MGVEKLSRVVLGLGRGVLGDSCASDTADAFLMASGKSSGRFAGCEDDADDRFSDIVFRIFFPASLVCKNTHIIPSSLNVLQMGTKKTQIFFIFISLMEYCDTKK